ncbi:trehalose-phosphatase [Janibacter corallicola]|uniref:trehalose-phosphatase n=1 Tax=Janibacter corallicola TaxID=415212 RepID=UPI00083637F8|nr:trehalose-phosphatase [Janibacter corallicola]
MTGEGAAGALERVAGAGRLLVASDFDGVLAPFVMDPMDARAQEGTTETLRALAALPRTWSAVVSGRDLATLEALTGLAGSAVVRIGSHGAETTRESGTGPTAEVADRLRRLREAVHAAVAERDPAIRVEEKPTAVVLHTRGLAQESVAVADEIAAEAATAEGVGLLTGKAVHELSVVRADKGTALQGLAGELGADAIVYLGDDVTDEHVFAVLGPHDLGIKVGDGETAATVRLTDATEVPGLLTRLREQRAERVARSGSGR